MSTLGGAFLEVVVRQPPHSTLAEQQLNLSFTGTENKEAPLRKKESLSEWKSVPLKKVTAISNLLPGDTYTILEETMLSIISASSPEFKMTE